jgi:hypothetical protein
LDEAPSDDFPLPEEEPPRWDARRLAGERVLPADERPFDEELRCSVRRRPDELFEPRLALVLVRRVDAISAAYRRAVKP